MNQTAIAPKSRTEIQTPKLMLGGGFTWKPTEKYAFLFAFGGVGYGLIELMWRGRTHPSMVLTGGACLAVIYKINQRLIRHSLFVRCLASATAVTGIELAVGLLVNRVMKLGVWDYSAMHFQFMGQICLLYSFFWFFLSGFLILCMKYSEKMRTKK